VRCELQPEEHVTGPTQIVIGGAHFVLDRDEGLIKIKDFNSLEFTPATLAYVLKQFGPFEARALPISHWGIITGTTDDGLPGNHS
jgi:hypothetical protein